MKIRAGFEIDYECPAPSPLLLMLSVRPERTPDLLTPDILRVDPATSVHQYADQFGNICSRVLAPEGLVRFSADFTIQSSDEPDVSGEGAVQHPVHYLPDDVIVYLLGSRYCETDKLSGIAWDLFGGTEVGWPRVRAIIQYVHERITFGYHNARNTRTAFEAYNEQVGVCRDYAHLAVAFLRCMNIPARYCTGYLGDIGVPVVGEMDFSAWVEVYLGDRWYTVDARHNKPRIGRIVMAHGRDATDVALATTFGATRLARFKVITEKLD
ncbi:MAG: transglutaminase family protein [Pseudomonadota bacterium]|jgi:transglutaminase-like putative cysteine protease|nr:transglutaminase family protein [Pseudomonadota bacterium]